MSRRSRRKAEQNSEVQLTDLRKKLTPPSDRRGYKKKEPAKQPKRDMYLTIIRALY